MAVDVVIRKLGRGGEVLEERTHEVTGDDELRLLAPEHLGGAYNILRSWAEDARTTDANWDTMTPAQQNQAVQVVIRRLGVFMDRIADLLVVQRIG